MAVLGSPAIPRFDDYQQPVLGANAAVREWYVCVIEHAHAESYDCFVPMGDLAPMAASLREQKQYKAVYGTCNLWPLRTMAERLAAYPPNVVCDPRSMASLAAMHTLRQRLNAFWPIAVAHHSLHAPNLDDQYLQWLVYGTSPGDAVCCATESARDAIKTRLAVLKERLARNGVPTAEPPWLPIIPWSVDTERFKPSDRVEARRRLALSEDPVMFLWLGRLSPATKADLRPLLVAFARAKRQASVPGLLVLAGEDRFGYSRFLSDEAHRLGVADALVCRPRVTDTCHYYAAADVCVAPSDNVQEAFGLGVIESLASGVPVIASHWNGYKSLVTPEVGISIATLWSREAAFAVSPTSYLGTNDANELAQDQFLLAQTVAVDVEALTRAISQLWANRDKREALGHAARLRATRLWSRAAVAQKMDLLLEEMQLRAADGRSQATRTRSAAPELDYGQVFDAYPSRWLGPEYTLHTSATEDEPGLLAHRMGLASSLDKEVLGLIMSAARHGIPLGSVASGANMDLARLMTHALWLLKQGFVHVSAGAEMDNAQGV